MTQIYIKLKNNSGASMILALTLMLICVMVSSVIITSAASGSSRNIKRTDQQRDYLAVSSGAQLVARNLKEVGTFVGSVEADIKPCHEYKNNIGMAEDSNGELVTAYSVPISPIEETIDFFIMGDLCSGTNTTSKVDDTNTSFQGLLADLMYKAASYVYLNNNSFTEEFYIELPNETERLPKVKCVFTMNQNYNVRMEVASESGSSEYFVVITMNTKSVDLDRGGSIKDVSCTKPHNVCYKVLEKGSWVQKYDTMTFSSEVSSPVTTVTWNNPVIMKGVD